MTRVRWPHRWSTSSTPNRGPRWAWCGASIQDRARPPAPTSAFRASGPWFSRRRSTTTPGTYTGATR